MSTAKHQNDLIITGYIKRMQKSLSIVIPEDIKKILLIFYSRFCDSWNTNVDRRNGIIIKDNYCQIPVDQGKFFYTVYGNHIISNGDHYEWTIKTNDTVDYWYIGIIQNNEKKMIEHGIEKNSWNWFNSGYLFHGSSSCFYDVKNGYGRKQYGQSIGYH